MSDESFWSGIIGAVIAAIGGLVALYLKLSGHWHKQDTDTDSRLVKEYREVVKDLRKELHSSRNREMEATEHLAKCQIGKARAEEWIVALEDILTRNEIKFRRWTPSNDSSRSMDIYDPPDLES